RRLNRLADRSGRNAAVFLFVGARRVEVGRGLGWFRWLVALKLLPVALQVLLGQIVRGCCSGFRGGIGRDRFCLPAGVGSCRWREDILSALKGALFVWLVPTGDPRRLRL